MYITTFKRLEPCVLILNIIPKSEEEIKRELLK